MLYVHGYRFAFMGLTLKFVCCEVYGIMMQRKRTFVPSIGVSLVWIALANDRNFCKWGCNIPWQHDGFIPAFLGAFNCHVLRTIMHHYRTQKCSKFYFKVWLVFLVFNFFFLFLLNFTCCCCCRCCEGFKEGVKEEGRLIGLDLWHFERLFGFSPAGNTLPSIH